MNRLLCALASFAFLTACGAPSPTSASQRAALDEDGPPVDCPPGSQDPRPDEICLEACYRPPPKPPADCVYEVRLSGVGILSGQGLSEGPLELSASFSVNGAASSAWSAPPDQLSEDQSATTDQLLGLITVPWHQQAVVQVNGAFTEDDNGGANGQDDNGAAATTPLVLRCPGAQKLAAASLPVALAGDKTDESNGMVIFSIEVIQVDADGDTVANEDDHTRTYCEEHNKGKLGEAVVIYEEYDDGPVNSLAQAVGISINNAWDDTYDGLALIYTDEPGNSVFGLDDALKSKADLRLPSNVQSIETAAKLYTRKGYALDLWVLAHGMTDVNDGGECAPWPTDGGVACSQSHISAGVTEDDSHGNVGGPQGGDITEGELLYWFDPERTGTNETPLRMVYLGNCYGNDFAGTFTQLGAKVTSGTTAVNVYPQKFNDMATHWVNGTTYDFSMTLAEVNPNAEFFSHNFIFTVVGRLREGCANVYTSSACAVDFWTDDPNSSVDRTSYLQKYYDFNLNAFSNMRIGTTRILVGDGLVSRGSTLSWR